MQLVFYKILSRRKCLVNRGVVVMLLVVLFGSCRKVINVDIEGAEKKYVIEAEISDLQDSSRVIISTSANLSESNDFPGISRATVKVTDEVGISTIFKEDSAGYYSAPLFRGVPGKTYSLEVTISGKMFTAVSAMPQKIKMDTLFISDELLFGEARKIANIKFQDPGGKGNCYRFVQYINGKQTRSIFVINDDYIDGRYIESKLWYIADDDEEKIKKGDTVRLIMFCIDQPIYKYWFSLFQSATGNSQSASPANPVSNIIGGALGYFSAHTKEGKLVKVN